MAKRFSEAPEIRVRTHSGTLQTVKLHIANDNDTDGVLHLNQQFALPIEPFPWTTREWVSQEIDSGNYLVTRDRWGCSSAICIDHTGNNPCIETIAVRQSLHRLGYGRALLDYVSEKARSEGKQMIKVASFKAYGLRNFYESCGFRIKYQDATSNLFVRELEGW